MLRQINIIEQPKIEVKCLSCSRLIEIQKDTIMIMCKCGEMFDLMNWEFEE